MNMDSNHRFENICAGNPMKYSKGVLLGCWYDERTALAEDAIQQSSEKLCEQHNSIYKSHYQMQDEKAHNEAVKSYFVTKQQSFVNFMQSRMSNIKLVDHQHYLNNMTTTSDFSYRINPQYVRSVGDDVLHTKKLDYSKVFGNVTTSGVRNYLKQQEKVDALQGLPYSIYHTSYNNANSDVRRLKA